MTAVVWPFPPREEMIEELQFSTDVMRAKSGGAAYINAHVSAAHVPARALIH